MDALPERRRFSQVNRTFRDVVLSSPLIQHKIDLYAAGFEYNPAAGIELAKSQKALHQYLSNLHSLCPIEEWTVEDARINDDVDNIKAVGGVMAILNKSVRLFTLGSSSRRIPHKEWKIPRPAVTIANYGFYPGADIIAFVELRRVTYVHWSLKIPTASSP